MIDNHVTEDTKLKKSIESARAKIAALDKNDPEYGVKAAAIMHSACSQVFGLEKSEKTNSKPVSYTMKYEGAFPGLSSRIVEEGKTTYVFYGEKDFSNQGNYYVNTINANGGKVVAIPVADIRDFINGWNALSDSPENIGDVLIIGHSNMASVMFFENGAEPAQAISVSGKNRTGTENTAAKVSDLEDISIGGSLFLYTCNSANMNLAKQGDNLAEEFLNMDGINSVVGYDGSVGYGDWFSFITQQYPARLSNSQPGFYEEAEQEPNERQEPLGELIYIEEK